MPYGGEMVAVMEQSAEVSTQGSLDTSNLMVERLVVHRIHARLPDKTIPPASYGAALIALPDSGRDALQKRIVAALGSRSHGVEMSIEGTEAGDFFQLAAHAIHQQDSDLIATSRAVADRLTHAQGTTNAPAGMLAVVTGRIGSSPKRFLSVIKADIQDGFGTGDDAENVDLTYLQNLMLTPTQKFYKVGLLLELSAGLQQSPGEYDPSNYRAFLFDHLITATETKQAAAYFYLHFLGMDIQKSSKKLTKDFFEHTKAFVASSSLSDEEKLEMNPMICSVVNRLFFMSVLVGWRTLLSFDWYGSVGAGHRHFKRLVCGVSEGAPGAVFERLFIVMCLLGSPSISRPVKPHSDRLMPYE